MHDYLKIRTYLVATQPHLQTGVHISIFIQFITASTTNY